MSDDSVTYKFTQECKPAKFRLARAVVLVRDDGKFVFVPAGTVLTLPAPAGPLKLKRAKT